MLMKINSRIIVKRGVEHFPLMIDDVALFYTENRITFVYTKAGTKFIADDILTSFENKLDRERFYRVNRQCIINIDFIKSFRTIDKVKISIEMAMPYIKEPIIVSQEGASKFRQWVEGKII